MTRFFYLVVVAAALAGFTHNSIAAVLDAGFESATPGAQTGSLGDGAWTCTQGTIYVDLSPTHAHNGTNSVQLTYASDPNTILQTLTTVAGQVYTLSFYVASDDGTDPFQVMFGGQVVTSTPVPQTFPRLGTPNGNYIQESFTVTATSSSTNLTFQSQYGAGFSSYGTFLDDVSVEPVPEPGSLALLGAGLIGVLSYALRRHARLAS